MRDESSVSGMRDESSVNGMRGESSVSGMRDEASVGEQREGLVSERRDGTRSALMRVVMRISILRSRLLQKSSKHLLCNILKSG